MNTAPVLLELNVQSMKHAIIHAFHNHALDIEKSIEIACDRYIKGGEMQAQIDVAFKEAIDKEIKGYFQYGKGNQLITETVNKGFEKMMTTKKTKARKK
jgi:hypothetical protein